MIDPNAVADDLDTQVSVHDLSFEEPEAGFAPGHHADIRQGIRNGDFSEPPPQPDLPIDDLTNKLPGWSCALVGESVQPYWVADPTSGSGGRLRFVITDGVSGDSATLTQPITFLGSADQAFADVLQAYIPARAGAGTGSPTTHLAGRYLLPDKETTTGLSGDATSNSGFAGTLIVDRINSGVSPTDAGYDRVSIGVELGALTTGELTQDVTTVVRMLAVPALYLADVEAATFPGYIEQRNGKVRIAPRGSLQTTLDIDQQGAVAVQRILATFSDKDAYLGVSGGHLRLEEMATPPATPAATQYAIYPKPDGELYSKNDAGTEKLLSVGAVAGVYQPIDSDLTAIAALAAANDDVLQRKAGAWANRTIAQLLTDLAVPGTTFQPLDADLTAIAALATTAVGRSLLAGADAAALRIILGLGDDLTGGDGSATINRNNAGTVGGLLNWVEHDAAANWSARTVNDRTWQLRRDATVMFQIAFPTLTATLPGLALVLAADPTAALGAATKQYVDSVAAGLDVKPSVRVATTAQQSLSGAATIDGVVTSVGDRILVRAQTAPAENGIYLRAAGAWTRATDMDAWAEVPGAFVFVEEGTLYADTAHVATANAGGTLGTTAITWSQFAGAGTYSADGSLVLTGTQFGRAALTGDVTASAGSNATTIPNDTVTYAKLQNVSATDKLLGRATAGAGDVEEIALTAAGRALIDDADSTAQLVTLGAYPLPWSRGTSFPGSPATGWRCTRTDRGIDYEYDGTRWLSVKLFTDTLSTAGTGVSAAGGQTVARAPVAFAGLYDLWLVSADLPFLVEAGGTALDASNKWQLDLYKQGAAALVASWTVNSGLNTYRNGGAVTIGALLGTTNFAWQVFATKTGAPGVFSGMPRVNYRLVG